MLSYVLLVATITSWNCVYSDVDTDNVEFHLNTFDNNTGGSQTVPAWGPHNATWQRVVSGDNPSTGPSWSTLFATLGDQSVSSQYSGGGESVPAYKRRLDYVPFTRETGDEIWQSTGDPLVFASRDRLWEVASAKTYRLIDLQGNPGGGN